MSSAEPRGTLVEHVRGSPPPEVPGRSSRLRQLRRDALIVAAAESSGCRRILSEDPADGETYGTVVVENPFIDVPPAAESEANSV